MSLSDHISSTEECQTPWSVENSYGDDDESFLRRATPYSTVPRWRVKAILKILDESDQDLPGAVLSSEQRWKNNETGSENFTDDQSRHREQVVRDDRLSVQYNVIGLRANEVAVIGLYIDEGICPGFRYRVRYTPTEEYAFDGEPRTLVSIGIGYSRRLTFAKGQGSSETCCFWPDNRAGGYGFSLDVLLDGDKFTVTDAMGQAVGEAVVQSSNKYQIEQSMEAKNGDVKKYVSVQFVCTVTYFQRHSDIISIDTKEEEVVEGIAEVVKLKREKVAFTKCITDVFLPRTGKCTFYIEK